MAIPRRRRVLFSAAGRWALAVRGLSGAMGALVVLQPLATAERFGQPSFGRATEANVAGAALKRLFFDNE